MDQLYYKDRQQAGVPALSSVPSSPEAPAAAPIFPHGATDPPSLNHHCLQLPIQHSRAFPRRAAQLAFREEDWKASRRRRCWARVM